MVGYKDVLLRQAQVEDAEEKAAEAERRQEPSSRSGVDGGGSSGSLPYILRVQDPWKSSFVEFMFRDQQQQRCELRFRWP